MGLEEGETVLFRLDDEGGLRLVPVPADPWERLEIARERGSSLDVDATDTLDREREQWS